MMKPIKFDGSTFLKFPNMVYRINLTHYNLTAEDYDAYDFPEPWTDVDLSYPTEYDLEDDIAFLEEEDYEDEEKAEEMEMLEKKKEEEMVSLGEEVEELEDGSGLFSLYDDEEALLEEQEYYSALATMQKDASKHENNLIQDNRTDQETEGEDLGGKRGQTTNHFEIRFRATAPNGVLVWLNKGTSVSKDYLSLTINGGFVELSFNLGTQQSMLIIKSKIRVDDGQWHTLVVHRRKRLGVLRVDNERPVKGIAERGATTLNTNGKLWIGGSSKMPDGLPHAYYQGFHGCIDSVQVENRDLNLVTHGDAPLIRFCDEMR